MRILILISFLVIISTSSTTAHALCFHNHEQSNKRQTKATNPYRRSAAYPTSWLNNARRGGSIVCRKNNDPVAQTFLGESNMSGERDKVSCSFYTAFIFYILISLRSFLKSMLLLLNQSSFAVTVIVVHSIIPLCISAFCFNGISIHTPTHTRTSKQSKRIPHQCFQVAPSLLVGWQP
jgi:hypothetical protein